MNDLTVNTLLFLLVSSSGFAFNFATKLENAICKADNFGCDEPESYRCGCQWQYEESGALLFEDKCIPMRWTCDAHHDCLDGSDEVGCFCPSGSYKCGCDPKTPNCKEGRGCINISSLCDGSSREPLADCRDGSDESQCGCMVGEYKCGRSHLESGYDNDTGVSRCVEASTCCDGCADCQDGSDETECSCLLPNLYQCGCPHDENNCSLGRNCIGKELVCNGRKDCKDGSDEIGCGRCTSNEFCCDKECTQCIAKKNVCDGYPNCRSGADENECCSKNKFLCSDRTSVSKYLFQKLIDISKQCDGKNDCGDWSDEVNCEYDALGQCGCHSGSVISCTNDYAAISLNQFCDGSFDCSDGSDEICECMKHQFQCQESEKCINKSRICDGTNDCGDWEDERNCTCSNEKFQCLCYTKNVSCSSQVTQGCLDRVKVCDGINDCGDWSDEQDCKCPSSSPFPCNCYKGNITCKSNKNVCYKSCDKCNGISTCEDNTDEMGCFCGQNQVRCGCVVSESCSSQGICIEKYKINNGVNDCPDGDDEICSVTSQLCEGREYKVFVCDTIQKCIHSPLCVTSTCFCSNVTNNVNDSCPHGSWICTSIEPNSDTQQQCRKVVQCSSKKAILAKNFCDRIYDCDEDEIIRRPGFKCAMNTVFSGCVVPQDNLYDDVPQCRDHSDICFVNGSFNCFRCLDGKLIISPSQVCNGIVDCYDLSDECLCKNQTVCHSILGKTYLNNNKCSSEQMPCNGTYVNKSDVLCNSVIDCDGAADEQFCCNKQKIINPNTGQPYMMITCQNKWGIVEANLCDGVPECRELEDECLYCSSKPAFCNDSCHEKYPIGDRYCDGRKDDAFLFINSSDCPEGFDELRCNERFYCEDKMPISIDKSKVCNGVADCLDGSDEFVKNRSCPNRIYCESGTNPISVYFTQAGDGKYDCQDKSDECPSESEDTMFSSKLEMIANPFLKIIIWIIAIFAVFGNVCVIIHSSTILFKSQKVSPLTKVNHMLLLNLGCADLLMGIYLVIIGAKSVEFSGNYCHCDKHWRTSSQCSGAGALAIVASEASVFLLCILTVFRLYSVFYPFKVCLKRCMMRNALMVMFAWCFAITLAVIPLSSLFSSYFVFALWFPNSIFSSNILNRKQVRNLMKTLHYFLPKAKSANVNNWNEVVAFLTQQYPSRAPKGEMGYYSDSPVCLPRFYVSYGGEAWQYSLFIITLNFILFFFIAIGYIALYKQSKKNLISSKASEQNRVIQRKVVRLIITDSICWVPICLMAYIQLAGWNLDPVAYVISATVLLPVNSALNPLLYSPVFERLWDRFHTSTASPLLSKRLNCNRPSLSTQMTSWSRKVSKQES